MPQPSATDCRSLSPAPRLTVRLTCPHVFSLHKPRPLFYYKAENSSLITIPHNSPMSLPLFLSFPLQWLCTRTRERTSRQTQRTRTGASDSSPLQSQVLHFSLLLPSSCLKIRTMISNTTERDEERVCLCGRRRKRRNKRTMRWIVFDRWPSARCVSSHRSLLLSRRR